MATITLAGNSVHTLGELPHRGEKAPNATLVAHDLSDVQLSDFAGFRIVLNIFPSIDTGICANSVRKFNEAASSLENTKVLCISRDLPFAQARFCGAEGLNNVIMLSDFREGSFGSHYHCTMTDGPLANLLSRAIVIIDENGTVIYTEQVPEIKQDPDFAKALAAL